MAKNVTPTIIVIVFMTTVCFAYNSSILDDTARQSLDQLVSQLDSLPDYTIYLSGHTDNTGTSERNLQLSAERTLAVKNYLLLKNVDSSKIMMDFFGENEPVVPNTTEENLALNRRVEVMVSGQKIAQQEPETSTNEEPKVETTVSKDETLVVPVKYELKKTKKHRRLVWTGWRTGFHWSNSGK